MNLHDLHPPTLEISPHETLYRIQRTRARRDSVRIKGYVLAPIGGLTGRFDLPDEPIAYLADSPETALYEAVFRREVRSYHWDCLLERSLVAFETRTCLQLADLRGLEESYPVLQSMRYELSQKFAQDCQQKGLHGIVYASAQHPRHSCICLFKLGIEHTIKRMAIALVEPISGNLHHAVVNAARGSQVPIIRE